MRYIQPVPTGYSSYVGFPECGLIGSLEEALRKSLLQVLPSPRRQACLQTVLRGEPQKAVGVDLGIAAPTIAGMLRAALSDMGLDMPFSRIPIAIPLLAHAAETGLIASSCEIDSPSASEPVW